MDPVTKPKANILARPHTFSPAKLRLLDAATKLFGQHGIDAVALKDINAFAGQKNQSAIQYHFGGRDGLIVAAMMARFHAIDARRLHMVEAARELSPAERRRMATRATVEPIVAEAEAHKDGPLYIRFVSQALQRPECDPSKIIMMDAFPGLKALSQELAHHRTRPMPRPEIAQRIRMSALLTMAAVADWVAQGYGPMSRESLIETLAAANAALVL